MQIRTLELGLNELIHLIATPNEVLRSACTPLIDGLINRLKESSTKPIHNILAGLIALIKAKASALGEIRRFDFILNPDLINAQMLSKAFDFKLNQNVRMQTILVQPSTN